MLKKEVIKLLQAQVNEELASAYLYQHFVNLLEQEGLSGIANWFKVQVKEELSHANIFMEYLELNNVLVELKDIKLEKFEFKGVGSILEGALKHEQHITACINKIYDEAVVQKDYRTMQVLNWFVKEQMEEEVNAQELIDRFKLVEKSGGGLYALDKELAKREFEEPDFELV